MARKVELSDLRLGSAERVDGTPVSDSAIIYAGHIDIAFDGEGSDNLAIEVERACNAHDDLVAALKALDDHWTRGFPGGPDAADLGYGLGRIAPDTIAVWRAARAALAKAEA